MVIKRTTLKKQVYEHLKEQIILALYNPGERLIEEKIAESLDVSRSPVREAIRMLEKDGLVIVNQSGGVNVVDPKIDDYLYLYEYRKEVEAAAAYYAAERRTEQHLQRMREHLKTMENISSTDYKLIHQSGVQFHSAIVEASANPFLISALTQLQGINIFYRRTILNNSELHMKKAVEEHQQIYEAIKKQAYKQARQLMRRHIENDYNRFFSLLKDK